MPVNGVQVLDGGTGELLGCVTDRDTTSITSPIAVDNEAILKEACFEECKAAGYCCNDPDIGSNQLLSCAQACMIRARGTDEFTCKETCDIQRTSRGCTRVVNGYAYSMCSSCRDLDSTCPHGVQEPHRSLTSQEYACHDGCRMAPPTTDNERLIAGQCCAGCGLPWEVPSSVVGRFGGFAFAVSMRVSVDGVFQTSGTLAAYVGDEVRGVATPAAVPFGPFMNLGTVLFQVSVYVNQTERLKWKFCDGANTVPVEAPCSFTEAGMWSEPFENQYLAGCVPGDGCMNHGSMSAAKAACIAAGDACGGVLSGRTHRADPDIWEIRRGRVPQGNTQETSYTYTPMCPSSAVEPRFGGPTDDSRHLAGTASDSNPNPNPNPSPNPSPSPSPNPSPSPSPSHNPIPKPSPHPPPPLTLTLTLTPTPTLARRLPRQSSLRAGRATPGRAA